MEHIRAFLDYIGYEKKYSVHTLSSYETDLTQFSSFLKNEFGEIVWNEVPYSYIRSWIVYLSDGGCSSATINRKITSLKSFYNFLIKIKYCTVNPLSAHKALKKPKKVQIPFSEQELSKLLGGSPFSDDFEGIRDQFMLELFYTTGMRRAELIGLKVHSIDPVSASIRILGKRNKERLVPLLPQVVEIYLKYLGQRSQIEHVKDQDVLFLTIKGIKMSPSLVYRLINLYLSAVSNKVKKSPHMLRHSFATHLLNEGADINSVKELLGHSSLASTQVYTHTNLKELKNVFRAFHPRSQDDSK
ncbi:MAG: integrase [Flavobacterium sp. BFFFF2]|nr:MAG: integrase [Flavobacterium sp. BFFFF2]